MSKDYSKTDATNSVTVHYLMFIVQCTIYITCTITFFPRGFFPLSNILQILRDYTKPHLETISWEPFIRYIFNFINVKQTNNYS